MFVSIHVQYTQIRLWRFDQVEVDSQESGEAYNMLKIRLESSHYKSSGAGCSQFARHTKNTARAYRESGCLEMLTIRLESCRLQWSRLASSRFVGQLENKMLTIPLILVS